jgi:hypothetical protein
MGPFYHQSQPWQWDDFLPGRTETPGLCLPVAFRQDRRIQALLSAIAQPSRPPNHPLNRGGAAGGVMQNLSIAQVGLATVSSEVLQKP